MEIKSMDPRTLRTQQSLKDAFIFLLCEKDFSVISITDIVNRSDLNRSTFYAHFRDKEDLLTCIIEELLEGLIQSMHESTINQPIQLNEQTALSRATYNLFTYIADHSFYFTTLLNKNGKLLFMSQFSKGLYRFFLQKIEQQKSNDSQQIHSEFFANYLSSALIGFVYHWLITTNMKYSPGTIAKEFANILFAKPHSLLSEPAVAMQ